MELTGQTIFEAVIPKSNGRLKEIDVEMERLFAHPAVPCTLSAIPDQWNTGSLLILAMNFRRSFEAFMMNTGNIRKLPGALALRSAD
jgi:hypothetical protein